MALQNEDQQLSAAWRALDGKAEGRGWQAIELSSGNAYSVMAGRRGPGNEESLIVGIHGVVLSKDAQLPCGKGFAVIQTEMQGARDGMTWLAVVRQPSGQLPLFTLMTADLVSMLRKIGAEPGPRIYSQVASRIKAWQHFMSRDRPQVLTTEEEVGLVGELAVLCNLISDGLSQRDAIEAWVGPDGGLHDFVLGAGGIEAKTTLSTTGFIARVGSLEQLDNSLHQPLYIGAVRLIQAETGRTLPTIVDETAKLILGSGAESQLEAKLASAGYLEMAREHYTRKFLTRELAYRLVTEQSPRLTRSGLPAQILEARYTLDLEPFPVVASTFNQISASLGIKG